MDRNSEAFLNKLLGQFPVVVILGARQCGKTTIAQKLQPSFKSFDLERPSHYHQITSNTELFFQQYPHDVIIDEAQLWPELFSLLRSVIDENRSQKGRFIITGSSSPELKNKVTESLAGRAALIELGTLKANEIEQKPLSPFYQYLLEGHSLNDVAKLIPNWSPLKKNTINDTWFIGGYPEIHLEKSSPDFVENWFSFYEASYLNQDISKLFPKLNKYAYQRFVKMLAYLSGTIINKAQFARDIEVSESTVKEYLSIVEGTYLWRNLPSFEGGKSKTIVKMPKGHLRDSGLLHHLLNLPSQDAILHHPHVGRSFESFVIEEMLKGFLSLTPRLQAYHYRTRGGAEVDLVLEGKFGLLPVEIKYSAYTPLKKLTSLRSFIKGQGLPYGLLVNQAEDIRWVTEDILQVPIQYL